MKKLTRTTVFALGLRVRRDDASAQVHPVLDRGFSPENVYQVGDIDSVNTFNGNLSLSIPIGGTYPVGGRLSYQLTLVYNSSFWDNASRWEDAPRNCPRGPGRCVPRRAIPTRFDTAGVGWRLSLGDLAAPHSLRNRSPNWLYVASDGSRHAFVDTLHEGDPARSGRLVHARQHIHATEAGGAAMERRLSLDGARGGRRDRARLPLRR